MTHSNNLYLKDRGKNYYFYYVKANCSFFIIVIIISSNRHRMKPSMVADEMFPEGAGPYMDLDEPGGSGGLLMDLTANEKAVHADFHNDFDDLFDDEDLS